MAKILTVSRISHHPIETLSFMRTFKSQSDSVRAKLFTQNNALPNRLYEFSSMLGMAQGRIWVKNRKIYNSGEIY